MRSRRTNRSRIWFYYFRNRFFLGEALSVFFQGAATLHPWTTPSQSSSRAALFRGAPWWLWPSWLPRLACWPTPAILSEQTQRAHAIAIVRLPKPIADAPRCAKRRSLLRAGGRRRAPALGGRRLRIIPGPARGYLIRTARNAPSCKTKKFKTRSL